MITLVSYRMAAVLLVRVWDVRTGDVLAESRLHHHGKVKFLTVDRAQDPAWLLSATDDGMVTCWSLPELRLHGGVSIRLWGAGLRVERRLHTLTDRLYGRLMAGEIYGFGMEITGLEILYLHLTKCVAACIGRSFVAIPLASLHNPIRPFQAWHRYLGGALAASITQKKDSRMAITDHSLLTVADTHGGQSLEIVLEENVTAARFIDWNHLVVGTQRGPAALHVAGEPSPPEVLRQMMQWGITAGSSLRLPKGRVKVSGVYHF